MNLSRERKILLIVCALGIGGVLVDRVFLGYGATDPAPSSAAEALALAATVNAPAAPASAPNETDSQERSFAWLANQLSLVAEDLPEAGRERPIDIFNVGRLKGVEVETVAAKATPASTHPFAEKHRLEAIMGRTDKDAFVQVDGKMLRIGERIDGFRLDGVNRRERKAHFVRNGEHVTLSISIE